MNRYEYMKNINIEQLGHFLCDSMDDLTEGHPCEHCPVNNICCAAEFMGNGWLNWLKGEHK